MRTARGHAGATAWTASSPPFAGRIAAFTGRPLAFILALSAVVVWAVTGPMFGYSETWQLVINTGTTIVTFLMVFLIQNTQNRDAAAIQAKLDELIRAVDQARNQFIGIEHKTDREIEEIRDEARGGMRRGGRSYVARGGAAPAWPALAGRSFRSSDKPDGAGRGDWIRTSDLRYPKPPRYQAAPRPDGTSL